MTSYLLILATASSANPLGQPWVLVLLMLAMFYLIVLRPQKRQRQELEARIASMEKGDRVITNSGLHGVIHQISEKTVTLKVGGENAYLTFEKTAIQVVNKLKNEKIEATDLKTK